MSYEWKETVTYIIAAKRREADFIEQSAKTFAKAGETTAGAPYDEHDLEQDCERANEIRREADRLEAALKRELCTKIREPGNSSGERAKDTGAGITAETRYIISELRDLADHRDWHNHTSRSNRERISDIACRLEAAIKRGSDRVHRAMVIIAGIEMVRTEDPPRLWTALEDAYNELSDALGTDGRATADEEEAKATGRHFVVNPAGDRAKMRAALVEIRDTCNRVGAFISPLSSRYKSQECQAVLQCFRNAVDALAAAPAKNQQE